MKRLAITVAVAIAMIGGLSGCGGSYDSGKTVREVVSERGGVVSPTYTPAQEAEIRAGVRKISPGHDNRKTIDWARATCLNVREGSTDENVIRAIKLRWAGGYNAAPELSQAAAEELLDFLRPYCAT